MKPAESIRLMQRVWEVYVRRLRESPAAAECLKALHITNTQVLEHFHAGYSDGSVPRLLPKTGELQDTLRANGLLNETGEETLCGCLVVPVFGDGGSISGFCGLKPGAGAKPKEVIVPSHLNSLVQGNLAKDVGRLFVANRILDTFRLWLAGVTNVVMTPRPSACIPKLHQLIDEYGGQEIYVCFSCDHADKVAAEQLKDRLLAGGCHAPVLIKAVHVVRWPEGVRAANDFFLSRGPQDFEALLQAFKPPAPPESEQTANAGEEQITMTPDGFIAAYGPRRYEIRAIEKPRASRLKATIRATGQGRFVIDTVDLYLSRSRRSFAGEVAKLFKERADVVETDINRLIEQLERYVQRRQTEGVSTVTLITEADQAEGMKLGRQPDLAREILQDLERLGLVGEKVNKLAGYLVMTSRKLVEPLALLILSGSGAGKSLVQDTLLKLCPDEDLVKLTSLSDRALFYKGKDSLKNKVLALEEVAGAEGAYYAIRSLISAKKLIIETTVKNPLTGQLTTQLNTVNGPTAVFQTTTQPNLDAETRSRFIVTNIDETSEQTRAILEAQRNSHTLEGLRHRKQRDAIIQRHHAFQRLLKPLTVVNPYEPLLSYTEDRLAVRRDNPKYLSLILVVAFLHQMQRPVKHDELCGDYIETALADIAIANELATALFGQALEDLSRPGQQLLELVFNYVQGQAARQKTTADKIAFSRRELREALKWSEYQLRTYLDELAGLEYLSPLTGRQGQPFRYRLLYDGQGQSGQRFLLGLKSVEQLREEAQRVGISPEQAPPSSSADPLLRDENRDFEGSSLNTSHEVKPASGHSKSGLSRNSGSSSGQLVAEHISASQKAP